MDAVYVKDNMHIKWVSETGFVENITNIVKEYKESRNLMVKFALLKKILYFDFLNFAYIVFVRFNVLST